MRDMLKFSYMRIVISGFLVSGLLCFLHMIVWLQVISNNYAQQTQEKLGIYLYLRESQDPAITASKEAAVITLVQDLKSQWIKVQYINKQAALEVMQRRVPSVIDQLEQYGIKNPLPSTVLITFQDVKQYEYVMNRYAEYKDHFEPIDTMSGRDTIQAQQWRIASVMRALEGLQYVRYICISMLVVLIISFFVLNMRLLLARFAQQLELEYYLWASLWFMIKPFLGLSMMITMSSLIVMVLMMRWGWQVLDTLSRETMYMSLETVLQIDIHTVRWYLCYVAGSFIILSSLISVISVGYDVVKR